MTVNPIAMALMPISHAASWYILLQAQGNKASFYRAVAQVAAFYCAWALFKVKVQGDKKEMGHISMGLLATSSFLLVKFKYLVLAFTVMVILNFGVVIPYFANRGVTGIVKIVHKDQGVTALTMTWGYIFLLYLLGNIIMWGFVAKTLWGLP